MGFSAVLLKQKMNDSLIVYLVENFIDYLQQKAIQHHRGSASKATFRTNYQRQHLGIVISCFRPQTALLASLQLPQFSSKCSRAISTLSAKLWAGRNSPHGVEVSAAAQSAVKFIRLVL